MDESGAHSLRSLESRRSHAGCYRCLHVLDVTDEGLESYLLHQHIHHVHMQLTQSITSPNSEGTVSRMELAVQNTKINTSEMVIDKLAGSVILIVCLAGVPPNDG